MTPSLLAMLNDAEQQLVRETQPAALAKLDEDELLDLHARVRRARTKYIKLHRRRGSEQVKADSSRTRASAATARTAAKAEVFEEVLADVSRQLAKLAKASAAELKASRLEAARSNGDGRTTAAAKRAPSARTATGPRTSRTPAKASPIKARPINKKRSASTKAATARSQAKADRR